MKQSLALNDGVHVAIVAPGYEDFTYSQLTEQINTVALFLDATGVGKSARIAIAIEDNAVAILAIVTVACSAAVVPIDLQLTAAEIKMRLKLLEVDALLVHENETVAARAVAEEAGIPCITIAQTSKERLAFSLSAPSIKTGRTGEEGIAVIFQTSGTTEEPKFAPCLHSNILATAERVKNWFSLRTDDRCLSLASPCYSHGLTLTVLAPLLSGGSVAIPSSQKQVNLSEWFETLSPTWFSAAPATHLMISDTLASSASPLKHRIRMITSGGAQLADIVRATYQEKLGVQILEHYGMTETSQVSANLPAPGANRSGTVGIPPADTVMIAGPDFTALPRGETGEILVRGPSVIEFYLNNPELNRQAFIDGWFRTGDLGSIDSDGFLKLEGRLKELINRGGEKISPFEVEAVLLEHPLVREAVAFAKPHPRLGEDVAAAVVLLPGTEVSNTELRKFMSARLSWSKIPRSVIVLDSIPRGTGGKITRNKLYNLIK